MQCIVTLDTAVWQSIDPPPPLPWMQISRPFVYTFCSNVQLHCFKCSTVVPLFQCSNVLLSTVTTIPSVPLFQCSTVLLEKHQNNADHLITTQSRLLRIPPHTVHPICRKNKPPGQAAGADPSQCNSTNRQNPSSTIRAWRRRKDIWRKRMTESVNE